MSTFKTSRVAPLVPYGAVLIGLLLLKSAWIAILIYHAGIVIATRGRHGDRVGMGWNATGCVVGAAVCSAAGLLVYALWPVVHRPDVEMGTALTHLGLAGAKWWLFVAYFASVHPLLEELFWRDYLLSPRRKIDGSDLAFAGYHVVPLSFFLTVFWIMVTVLVLACAAWMWRLAVIRWRGLGVPLCTHGLADASVIIAAALIRAQTSA